MIKAIWNNQVIAVSDNTVVLEGNHYFPPESIRQEFFRPSTLKSTCPWKGAASYYTIEVAGKKNKDAAWFYKEPLDNAKAIKGHIAFWKGVTITDN